MGGSESKWREISMLPGRSSWNNQTETFLRDACLKGSNEMKILMFGPSHNGKSSLVNSMMCAMNGMINQYYLASRSLTSGTRSLYSPDVRVKGTPLRFKLTDMPGFFQGMLYAEDYLTAVLGGHIKEDMVVPDGPLDRTADYYIENPKDEDLPCCVVLVLRAGKDVEHEVKEKFELLMHSAQTVRLKVAVVLTHVDNLEGKKGKKLTGRNVSSVFHEQAVHQAVQQASNDTGIPLSFIHPVVNYTHEVETITEMNIMHMYTLKKILELAKEGAKSRRR